MSEPFEMLNAYEFDGIQYIVSYLDGVYIVKIVRPDGTFLTETFPATAEPRFGPDVADIVVAEQVMDRLINEVRNG